MRSLSYGLGINCSGGGGCSSHSCALVTNQNYGEAVPGWSGFNTRKQKVLCRAKYRLQKILLVSHPDLLFRLVPFPTVAVNVGFSWHSCSPLPWSALSPREPLCSGGYLSLLGVAYDQGLALSCTKDWLPDVEVGLTLCCSKSSHAMRLKLDILAWLLPLCYFASFFLPSSFWELSFNKVFARESLLLGNSKQDTCSLQKS